MKKLIPIVLFLLVAITACKSPEKTETITDKKETFTDKIENAHQKEAFLAKEAVQFDVVLNFGGKERLNAKMTTLTNSSKSVIEFKNGSKIITDGDKVFYSADILSEESVRFDAYTWNYFFLFPNKLSDPGTIWNPYENKEKDNANYNTEKLTFKSGTGDAPDDWYIVYADKKTNLVDKATYIVTLKAGKEEAEKDPHAIQYLNYEKVDGVPIATKWIFWGWKEGLGLTDELGNATLSNIKFIKADQNYFKPGADFKTK
ncbi:DUF6503 family protein [Frigoriflavimonas asaccharolytica]|uniref:Outer membrane lipoprotein-sorting protein n=1 Tax=Frigoriflavimonas asaccharolytica TaxID=2735899 RepID=A0A8J8G868_9FLAO|nr:DUF6503 family protein [Frigoriflavimonas asaccharolytica]NRS92948.1 hypothetical protein [Frigoriflavimonas asaccharolytica]